MGILKSAPAELRADGDAVLAEAKQKERAKARARAKAVRAGEVYVEEEERSMAARAPVVDGMGNKFSGMAMMDGAGGGDAGGGTDMLGMPTAAPAAARRGSTAAPRRGPC